MKILRIRDTAARPEDPDIYYTNVGVTKLNHAGSHGLLMEGLLNICPGSDVQFLPSALRRSPVMGPRWDPARNSGPASEYPLSVHLSLSRALIALAASPPSAPPSRVALLAPNLAADVWAVVDDREIRQADVEKAFRRVAPPQPVTSTDEELGGKLSLLDEMITQRVLLKRAAELKIEVTDAEVETAYGERKRNLPDDPFQQQLADRNLTVEDMKTLAARRAHGRPRDQTRGDRQDRRDRCRSRRLLQQEQGAVQRRRTAVPARAIVVTPVRDSQIRNRSDDATTPEKAKAKAQMPMGS